MLSDELSSIFKELGLKNTKIRRQIFEKLDHPVDAIDLAGQFKVNKTTIYRELKVLISKGLVTEIEFGDGKKRYELSSLKHHHHLICTGCKSISDVHLARDLDEEEKMIEKEKSFKVQRHNLEFFGLCSLCQS